MNNALQLDKFWEVVDMMQKWLILLPTNPLDEGLLPSLENKLTNLGTKPSTATSLQNNAIYKGDYDAKDG